MNPLLLLKLASWIVAALLGAGLLWFRGEYESEKAARAEDVAKANAAALAATVRAQSLSNELVIAQAEAMAITQKTVTLYKDRIINVPVTAACAQSPAIRASSAGVRELIDPGGRAAPAER